MTVNTRFLGERVAGLGVPRERIVHVPNGVDLQAWQPAPPEQIAGLRTALGLEGQRVIAYAGTLSLQNHPVDLLLDAMSSIARYDRSIMLLLIGGGEDLPLMRERITRAGLDQAVRCTGHVSRSALRALLGLTELTVDPVFDDAVARARSPLKIIESMALGVPVVTADVGDRRLLLGNGAAGILVTPGDAADLATGIVDLLASEARRATMSQHALRHIHEYEWSTLAERFENVYQPVA